MRQRLLSAAVLVPLVVVLFVLGPPWLTLAIALLAAFAAYEAAQLLRRAGFPAATWLAAAWTPLAVIALAGSKGAGQYVFVAPGIALLVLLAAIPAVGQPDPAAGFRSWLGTTIAGLYAGMLGFAALLVGLAAVPADGFLLGYPIDTGRLWLLILVATVWALDSAAYVIGRYYPRGHFMAHISPNKTWSGAIAGTVAAVSVCAALALVAGRPVLAGLFLGLVIAVAAQLGDLTESMLKRAAGAKDSGTLIPGHGGFLDRVDSFLFAAPAVLLAMLFVSAFTPWAA